MRVKISAPSSLSVIIQRKLRTRRLRHFRAPAWFLVALNHNHEFALQVSVSNPLDQLRGFSTEKFLELFRQLPGHDDLPVGHCFDEFRKAFFHAVQRFVQYQGRFNGAEWPELAQPLS